MVKSLKAQQNALCLLCTVEVTGKTLSLKQEGTGEEKCSRMAEVISFFELLGVQAFYVTNSPRQ